jgi:N4-gp56 family major capsid protein
MANPGAYTGYTPATDTSAVANATIDRFIPAKMLEVAKYNAQLYNLCPHVNIPPGESQTVTFIKYNHLALPTTPLAEGDSGTPIAGTTSRVSCVTEPWGAWQLVSSLGQYIAKGSPADIYATRQGVQAARVIDREIVRVLNGATRLFYPDANLSRSTLGATDTISYKLLRKVRAYMKRTGAPFYQGEKHVIVAGPEVCADLVTVDPTMINAILYQKFDILVSGEIGEIAGFRIVESNTIPSFSALATAPTTAVTTVTGAETRADVDGNYYISVTANDLNGFEVGYYPIGTVRAIATTNVVLTVATPAQLPTGYGSFNIYLGTQADGSDATLQMERAAVNTTYRISGNGSNALGIARSTSGRIVGVSPATGVTVHPVFFFGSEFFKCTQIKEIQTYRTSGAQKSDPLNRYQTLGWVIEGFRAVITDQTFGGKIEVASQN